MSEKTASQLDGACDLCLSFVVATTTPGCTELLYRRCFLELMVDSGLFVQSNL